MMTAWENRRSAKDVKAEYQSYYTNDVHPQIYKRMQYMRSKMTRVLRDAGLTVIKWPNEDINPAEEGLNFVPVNDFSESDGSDDEREEVYTNKSVLANFVSTHVWDPTKDRATNEDDLRNQWDEDLRDFYRTQGLKDYRTRSEDLESLFEDSQRMRMQGWPALTEWEWEDIYINLYDEWEMDRRAAKQERENERNLAQDPIHVAVPRISPQYQAWTVTNDWSVDGNGMVLRRYDMTDAPPTNRPFQEYHWFGAEVVSPVLPQGDERTRQSIRTACGALRDYFRIHKPMHVSTGLHVHVGHSKGWSLQQLKRFASLWYLAEDTIYHMQRRDRGEDRKWCARMADQSRLAKALYNAHIPKNELGDDEIRFLEFLWQIPTVTQINYCLGENEDIRTGLRWRVSGRQHTRAGDGTQTIEARIMAGTLDADHINNWAIVLERIVHTVRNLSDADFQAALRQIARERTRASLMLAIGVPDAVRAYWLNLKRRDDKDQWWEYPDKDKVQWKQPFMVTGHKHTHGALWDDFFEWDELVPVPLFQV
ncbi:putative amidoligase enzyme-domain-containing protein [Xylariaceae sp. FL0255]|nr:putative amidoligase enzyme-domain-containing protein [Xylariaceae sp. FL0255]